MKVKEAIDHAKSAYKRPPSEPLVPDDQVILRHLWHALELVSGLDTADTQAELHKALVSGAIKAKVKGGTTTIPAADWNAVDPDNSLWITGVSYIEHVLPGCAGELPAVDRKAAEVWLRNFETPRKLGRPNKGCAAAEVYRNLFPQGHTAANKSWKEAASEVGKQTGESITVDTLKRGLGLKS